MPIVNFIIIIILIAITAFFVASEFAIVRVRSSRINQLIAEGNQPAITAKKVISNLDSYLSAIQLGITVTSLILGWLGEPTIQVILNPILDKINFPASIRSVISFIISFSLITFFNVVLGELAPKSFAIQKTEAITLFVAKPLVWFNRIMYPFIWTLNTSSRFVTKLAGLKPASDSEIAPTEEELRIILSESLKSGEINQSEYKYVNNIFEFDNRIAKEIMVPRTEMVTLERDATIDDILEIAKVEKFTRYPITNGDKDSIIGIVNIKEILTDCIFDECHEENPIEKYVKPVPRVIETVPIKGLLSKIQKDRTHMVILLDEYGGTAGLVTVEDILEEIVGEIRDEFDSDEIPLIRKINDSHYILDAKILIEEVNGLLGTHILEEEIDTLGGWLLTKKYDLEKGDIVQLENFEFIVSDMVESHVQYVEVKKIQEAPK